MKVAAAIHRAALRLYPAAWRARMADDYHATVVARWRAAAARGRAACVALVLFTIADTCASGVAARLASARAPRRARVSSWRSPMTSFLRHLRYGARALRHAPGFTITAALTLAIGIGGATAAFTALNAAVIEPLPYRTGDRLAVISETRRGSEISVSYPDFFDWRDTARSFEAMAAFRGATVTLTGGAAPERAAAQIVTADVFTVLATAPIVGRAFTPDDDRKGAPRSVVLGFGLWQRMFGGDRAAIGRTLQIDGETWQIVGVMPEGFRFPDGVVYGPADLYMPAGPGWVDEFDNRDAHPGVVVIALLKPGISVDAAREEMDAIARDLAARYPDTNRDIGASTVDGVTALVGDLRGRLTGVAGASAVLLLIACANVAGLTLARAVSRRRELLVRIALGESRASLAMSLVAEHLLVAAAGAAGGLALAFALTGAMRPLVARLPRLEGLMPDLAALGFVIAVMTVATILVAVAPMLWLRRANVGTLGQRGQSAQGVGLRQVLAGGQIALAIVLLATSMLLVSSFRKLAADSGGIDATDTLSMQIVLPEADYAPARRVAFFEALLERLSGHPSITATGAISTLPFSGAGAQSGITPVNQPDADPVRVDVATIAGDYFAAMGIPILRGRAFRAEDGRTTQVAIVDERFAARFWPDQDPIGKRVRGWGFEELEVIGVARHVKNYGAATISREELYVPLAQRPSLRLHPVVRITGDPLALLPDVRRIVADLDPQLVVGLPRPMAEVVGRTIAGPRLAATLATAFGAVAFLLAAIGVYSLAAYSVTLRRREAAIRMALGAPPSRVVAQMVRGVAWAIGAGGAIGLAAAVAAGRLVESELFEISAADPVVLLLTAVAMTASGVVAAWLPARRAARVPAAVVLQQE